MSTSTEFTMETQIEHAKTVFHQCLGNLGSDNQSWEQIFDHCQEVKGFAFFSLHKHGLRNKSDKEIGNGILIGRDHNKWTLPVLVDFFHPSLHPSKFFEEQFDKNQNSDVLNYLLVLKDQRMIDYFIQTQEIILGKDYQILSTTNASKISAIPDALLLYNLIPSRGLQLICHLTNFYDMKMQLDADNTKRFYSDSKDFSLTKILYGRYDRKMDENYQGLLKIVDEKFLPSNRNQDSFLSGSQDSLLSKIVDKTKEGIDMVKNQFTSAADTVKDRLPSTQMKTTESTESKPIEKIINATAPQIDDMSKKTAPVGEVFQEAKYKNKDVLNDQMLPAQKDNSHYQPIVQPQQEQQSDNKKIEGSDDKNPTFGTAGLKAAVTNITNTISDKTKQLLGKDESNMDKSEINRQIFEANSKESKDKWMEANKDLRYKNKDKLNDQMVPRKNELQQDASSNIDSSKPQNIQDTNENKDKPNVGLLENIKEKLNDFFSDKDTTQDKHPHEKPYENVDSGNVISKDKIDHNVKKPPTSLGPTIAIPPKTTNTMERPFPEAHDQ